MGIETAIMAVGALATMASTVAPMVMNKKPDAPVAPPADTTPTQADDNATAQAAEAKRRKQMAGMKGRSSTILTSALGEQAKAQPTATLLGS